MAEAGQQLFQRNGLRSCHRGRQRAGPELVGVFGRQVPLEGGAIVTADEGYIRESILDAERQGRRGYQPIMPSFQGQLNEEQLMQLIAYIRRWATADRRTPGPARQRRPLEDGDD